MAISRDHAKRTSSFAVYYFALVLVLLFYGSLLTFCNNNPPKHVAEVKSPYASPKVWQVNIHSFGTNKQINEIGGGNGLSFVVAGDSIFTQEAGASDWKEFPLVLPPDHYLEDAHIFSDGRAAALVSEKGLFKSSIITSRDQGSSWKTIKIEGDPHLNSFEFNQGGKGLLLGWSGRIWKSGGSLDSWFEISEGFGISSSSGNSNNSDRYGDKVTDVDIGEDDKFYAITQDGNMLVSGDFGGTSSPIAFYSPETEQTGFWNIHVADNGDVVGIGGALSIEGIYTNLLVYESDHTDLYLANRNVRQLFLDIYWIRDVVMLTREEFVAVGEYGGNMIPNKGVILYSVDGGRSWDTIVEDTEARFSEAYNAGNDLIYVGATSGQMVTLKRR